MARRTQQQPELFRAALIQGWQNKIVKIFSSSFQTTDYLKNILGNSIGAIGVTVLPEERVIFVFFYNNPLQNLAQCTGSEFEHARITICGHSIWGDIVAVKVLHSGSVSDEFTLNSDVNNFLPLTEEDFAFLATHCR